MSKPKDKTPKPRPDKYAEKVAINVGFDDVLKIFSQAAHENTDEKIRQEQAENPTETDC